MLLQLMKNVSRKVPKIYVGFVRVGINNYLNFLSVSINDF